MGMIDRVITSQTAAKAASGLAEFFTENIARRLKVEQATTARDSHETDLPLARKALLIDQIANALNRLPRPVLTVLSLGLFGYAMADPPGFEQRMEGLSQIPEPLWWFLGAIISINFGAREAHFLRKVIPQALKSTATIGPVAPGGDDFADNAALRDWAASQK